VEETRITGRRYDDGRVVWIEMAGGRISALGAGDAASADLPWIAPGLVDLQVNGRGGQEFNDPQLTVEKVSQVALAMDSDGVTSFCPTATTHSAELLTHTLRVISRACDQLPEVARRVAAVHLEGPYISPEDGPRGAHPRAHCRPPDWDEFQRLQEAAAGRIRILTLSPEYDGAARFSLSGLWLPEYWSRLDIRRPIAGKSPMPCRRVLG
jgi:N-acetylglucosamine-6-phosphate deacetylase